MRKKLIVSLATVAAVVIAGVVIGIVMASRSDFAYPVSRDEIKAELTAEKLYKIAQDCVVPEKVADKMSTVELLELMADNPCFRPIEFGLSSTTPYDWYMRFYEMIPTAALLEKRSDFVPVCLAEYHKIAQSTEPTKEMLYEALYIEWALYKLGVNTVLSEEQRLQYEADMAQLTANERFGTDSDSVYAMGKIFLP